MTKQLRVGLYLSCGFTKKEIANMTGKSFHTINQETRLLYQKTGARNLADITCNMITYMTHVPVRSILQDALKSA
jgi:DNA-binding NarL/FixJ family response regulator